MACCIFVAFCMNRIIKACEVFDLQLINIQYNDFDTPYNNAFSKKDSSTSTRALRVSINGMTCAACVQTIENALLRLQGVDRASVSLPLGRATVVFDSNLLTTSHLKETIQSAGYEAKIGERTAEENIELLSHSEQLSSLRTAFSSGASLSSIIVAIEIARISFPIRIEMYSEPAIFLIRILIASWVQLYDARWIHRGAWTRGKMTLGMDALISLSLLLGMALSVFNITLQGWREAQTYFASGCFLTTVISAGRYLDLILRRKSTSNFAFLYRLQAETAMVYVQKDGTLVPAATLKKYEEIVIDPMSIVPCDCFVLEGHTVVDESSMTGELFPVSKMVGDFLMSGTRNISSSIVAVVAIEQQESSLERLIESLSSATEPKKDSNDNFDLLVRHFVTGILVLASLGFAISFFSVDRSLLNRFNAASQRAMTILAASCPCALGLAGPSATMAGLDAAWARGVLLLGGARTLESLDKITACVLDKTGTLTEGRLHVTGCYLEAGVNADLCYCLLYLVERDVAQSHPIGKAVFQWALQQLKSAETSIHARSEVRDYLNTPGHGAFCVVRLSSGACHSIHVGSKSFLKESDILVPTSTNSKGRLESNRVYFALDGKAVGFLTLRDKIRNEAPTVIRQLEAMGLGVTMLTGDNYEQASEVSSSLNIPVLSARSLPHEKQAWVQSLQEKGEKIAMIGDGINDSLAQAAADVGILLSLNRTCLTGASDVVIMSPNLEVLPKIFEIAKLSVKQANWNVRWAVGYNLVAVSLAFGLFERWGFAIDVSIAGTLMAFSSLTVLTMSLHLRQRLS